MVNSYLLAAYCLVWIIFMAYALVIHRRQDRLKREMEELIHELRGRGSSGAGNS